MSEELKPCPFCGGEPTIESAMGAISFACLNQDCPVNINGSGGGFLDLWLGYSREQAIAAWNTRAALTAQPSYITGEQFYMAMYADEGAIWSANEHQELWNTYAENLNKLTAQPETVDLEEMAKAYEKERNAYLGNVVYYKNNNDAFIGCMKKALETQKGKIIA